MDNAKPKVLLVEDNEVAQLISKKRLEDANCQVDIAANGKQALALANNNAYQVILMDIGLDDMNGFEVATKLSKGKLSKNPDVRIIAISAHSSADYKQQAVASGMEGFLVKPLTMQNIKDILDGCY